jgi:hypothetical protein
MKDGLHTTHTMPDARSVGNRAEVSRERRLQDVEADDLVLQVPQSADQSLAQVTGTSCNQRSHARLIPPAEIEILSRLWHEQFRNGDGGFDYGYRNLR